MFAKKIKAFQAFINSTPKPFKVSKIDPPKLTRKVENYRADVMLSEAESDMGLDKLEFKLTFEEYDADLFNDFGACQGKQVKVRVKASAENENCDLDEHEWFAVGRWKELDQGSIEAGKAGKMNVSMMNLMEYTYTINGAEKVYIDVMRGIERYNGVDRTAARRAAIGMG
jgi:hypothetical protein